MIGARVVNTCCAVTISILIAKSLHLNAYHFAGIVAVLSVQPSLYRSLRKGIQQMASAVVGAVFGAAALFTIGGSSLSMGLIAFLLMVFHVRIRWTNSLLVAVVIAINTMGTTGLSFWEAAFHQIALVLIGTGAGTLINLVQRPKHDKRANAILSQAEGMLRVLLHYMLIDIERKQISPYSFMKDQIDEIENFIRKGKEVSNLMIEDRKFRKKPMKNTLSIFQSFESMLEQIRHMTKALADGEFPKHEVDFAGKSLALLIKIQETIIHGRRLRLSLFKRVLDRKRNQMWKAMEDSEAFYHFYGYVKEYVNELEAFLWEQTGIIKKRLTYTSVDRPGLIAEISGILVKHSFNITNISIRVNGKFATTTMEITCEDSMVDDGFVNELLSLPHVLSVEYR
ncbi:aromatic acid exporter family protein [Paenibacillus chartarius]|uniref:Aromatic acid exporter family protein n=1 Tax=Paenibacillus chartarius TaxID=747481 RepID=A0ABV6DEN5_9BACL